MTASQKWRPLSLSIGLLYVLAAVAALIHSKDSLHAPDEFEYLSIGQTLVRSGIFSIDGVTPTAWRSPGFPAIIAVLWWIWPSVYLIKIVGLSCWLATGFLVGRLAYFFRGLAAGYLAALLYLFYAYELYAATTLYPQTVAGLLVALSVSAVIRPVQVMLSGQILLLAVTVLEIMVIPNCIVVAAVVYLYAIVHGKIKFRAACAAGAVTLIVIIGWCARNEQTIGGFTFTTTMGITLYDGNTDVVTGAGDEPAANSAIRYQTRGLSEIGVDKFFRARAVEWIKSHPWLAFTRALDKFVNWFAYKNEYDTRIEVPLIVLLTLAMAFVFYPVLVGAFMATTSGENRLREFAILSCIIYLLGALTYVLFLTRIRYRLPFDPLLFPVAACNWLDLATGRLRIVKASLLRERRAALE